MRASMLIALVGCGHGETPPETDGPLPDDGDTACAREAFIDGELIDWDSSDASFVGVFDATIQQVGDPTVVTTTPPNGRLQVCANPGFPLEFALEASGDFLDGTISIAPMVPLNTFVPLSLRTLTATRAASFFTEQGLVFDPNAAQVVVLSTGDRSTLTLDATHDTALAGEDAGGVVTWAAGSTGRYVLFPNVTPSAFGGQLTGDPAGTRTVPLVGGRISLVAISFFFVE